MKGIELNLRRGAPGSGLPAPLGRGFRFMNGVLYCICDSKDRMYRLGIMGRWSLALGKVRGGLRIGRQWTRSQGRAASWA